VFNGYSYGGRGRCDFFWMRKQTKNTAIALTLLMRSPISSGEAGSSNEAGRIKLSACNDSQ
jgi:hypothetical protein